MQKQIILLNGPSASGKSTLAKALQKHIREARGEEVPILSIDDYLNMDTAHPIYEDDVYEINAALCRNALTALKSAPRILVDHVITSERIFLQWRDAFASTQLVTVRGACPLAVLCERERARKDRCIGSAEASLRYLYPKDGYDITVDTSSAAPDACADTLYRLLFSEDLT